MRLSKRYLPDHYVIIRMLILLFDWTRMTSSFVNLNLTLYLPDYSQQDIEAAVLASNTDIKKHADMFVYLPDSNMSSLLRCYNSNSSKRSHATRYHVSYLPSSFSNHIKEYSTQQPNNYFWTVDEASCHVTSFIHQSDDYFCLQNYLSALEELIRYFYASTAVILTTNNKCSYLIGQKLLQFHNSTNHYEDGGNGIKSIEHFVISDENLTSNHVTNILRKLKMNSVDLIINILEPSIVDLLFEIALKYSLTHYSIVWLTIEHLHFDSNLNAQIFPWQWLDLRASHMDRKWERNTLIETVRATLSTFQSLGAFKLKNSTRRWLENITETLQTNMKNVKCNSTNNIIEIYARDPSIANEILWSKTIVWYPSQNKMQRFPKTDLLMPMMQRAGDPVTLKAVTIIDSPFTMYAKHLYNPFGKGSCGQGVICRTAVIGLSENDPNKWVRSCCVGMVIDLLLLLAEQLHFNPDVYIVEDGFYGGKLKNSTEWNGLIQDVRSGKADVAVAALTITRDRFEVVDFCEPYWKIDLGIMISTLIHSLSFINWEFLAPLTAELRIWILVTFILGTVLIYVLENQHLVLKRITDRTVFPRYQWREGFSYFSGLTFQRDLGGKNPKRYGARVTAIAFAFGMVIIMTTYTAVLTASKVSHTSSNPFKGFKDSRIQNPTVGFKYATIAHTSMESYFRKSTNEIHRRMYQFMINYNVNQSSEAIEGIQKGTLHAVIDEWPFLQYHASKDPNCTFKIYGEPIHQGGYAFSVPRNSPWKHLISQSILTMKKNDVIDQVYKKWFQASCSKRKDTTEYEGVEINYFGGLIFLLGMFWLVSIGLLGLEHFIYRHHRRVINPIQDKVQVWRESKCAARRNAIVDPNDISYLQSLHKKGFLRTNSKETADNDDARIDEESSDNDISEGEEELIRMRLGRNLPIATSPVKENELSKDMGSNGSLNTDIQSCTKPNRRQSIGNPFLALDSDALNALRRFSATLEVSDNEDDTGVKKTASRVNLISKDSGRSSSNKTACREEGRSQETISDVSSTRVCDSDTSETHTLSTRIDDISPADKEEEKIENDESPLPCDCDNNSFDKYEGNMTSRSIDKIRTSVDVDLRASSERNAQLQKQSSENDKKVNNITADAALKTAIELMSNNTIG